jgi:hypothetical protein
MGKARKRMKVNREVVEMRLRDIDEGRNNSCGPVVTSHQFGAQER